MQHTFAQSPREEAAKPFYRPEIDGLRAVAVVAVIINHFHKPWLPSGFLGVDIFFVISGYVITRSLLNQKPTDFTTFLGEFYARRIRRLVPAMVVFTLVSGVMICLVNPLPTPSLRTGASALLGLANVYLFKQSTDYFAQSSELNIFTHTWSLGVEEQFYLAYPAVFWLCTNGKESTSLRRRSLGRCLLILSIISFLVFVYWNRTDPAASYFLVFSRIWELGIGCLVALGEVSRGHHSSRFQSGVVSAGLGAMAVSMLLPFWMNVYTTPAVVASTAIVISGIHSNAQAMRLLTLQPIMFLGLISYSLYLWHWSVLCISRWTVGIEWWTVPIQLGLMVGLAYLSYLWIESPFRRSHGTRLNPASMTSIACGSGTSIVAALTMLLVLPRNSATLFRWASPSEALDPQYVEEPYVAEKPQINTLNCTNPTVDNLTAAMENCTLKPKYGRPTLYFLGDSQSNHLKGMAGLIHEDYGLGSQLLAISSMPYPTGYYWISSPHELERARSSRLLQNRLGALSIAKAREGDLLILSGRYIAYFSDYRIPISQRDISMHRYSLLGKEIAGSEALHEWAINVGKLLDQAAKRKVKVIVVMPFPEFPYSGSQCISYASKISLPDQCTQTKESLDKRTHAFNQKLSQLKRLHSNLYTFDPVPVLCPLDKVCRTIDGSGRLQYYDATHLSVHGSRSLALAFMQFLRSNHLYKSPSAG